LCDIFCQSGKVKSISAVVFVFVFSSLIIVVVVGKMEALEAIVTPFLKKLLSLTAPNGVPSNVAGWDNDGSTFIVHDGMKFEALLRNYFKGTLQTFVRQLHFYGFSKMDLPKLGPHSWCFSHPSFLRDEPLRIMEIRRKYGGGHGSASPSQGGKRLRNFPPAAMIQKVVPSIHSTTSFLPVETLNTPKAAEQQNTGGENEIKDLKETVKMLEQTVQMLVNSMTSLTDKNGKEGVKKQKVECAIGDSLPTKIGILPRRHQISSSEVAGLPFLDNRATPSPAKSSTAPDFLPLLPPVKRATSASSTMSDFLKELATGFPDEVETPNFVDDRLTHTQPQSRVDLKTWQQSIGHSTV